MPCSLHFATRYLCLAECVFFDGKRHKYQKLSGYTFSENAVTNQHSPPQNKKRAWISGRFQQINWRPQRDSNPCYRRKSGSDGFLLGLHGFAERCELPMITRWKMRFTLAEVCATLHLFGGHLVTTASPDFQGLDPARLSACHGLKRIPRRSISIWI